MNAKRLLKLFSSIGIAAATLVTPGREDELAAKADSEERLLEPPAKSAIATPKKLVLKGAKNGQNLFAAHRSHSSHRSHASHRSHSAHYSSAGSSGGETRAIYATPGLVERVAPEQTPAAAAPKRRAAAIAPSEVKPVKTQRAAALEKMQTVRSHWPKSVRLARETAFVAEPEDGREIVITVKSGGEVELVDIVGESAIVRKDGVTRKILIRSTDLVKQMGGYAAILTLQDDVVEEAGNE